MKGITIIKITEMAECDLCARENFGKRYSGEVYEIAKTDRQEADRLYLINTGRKETMHLCEHCLKAIREAVL
jgi:hypothetical protein